MDNGSKCHISKQGTNRRRKFEFKFKFEFKDGNNVIDIMLNRKKCYYSTNAITFIKSNGKTYSKAIKDLEKIAKEQLQLEKDNKVSMMISSSIQLDYVINENFYNSKNVPTWDFNFDEKEKEKYVKEYRYLDTADDKIRKFKTYDFLSHLRSGLDFNKTNQKTWQPRPIDKINFKLIDNDTKIAVRLDASQDLNFKKYMYEWDNTIMVYSYFNRKWYKSLGGWITIVHRLIYGIWAVDKKVVNDFIRQDVANYFLKEKDALVIAHEKNFEKMDNNKKSLVSFIIMSDRYLRVNFNCERILYVGTSSNLHKNFRKNFLSKCAQLVAWF